MFPRRHLRFGRKNAMRQLTQGIAFQKCGERASAKAPLVVIQGFGISSPEFDQN
jgi:hypothetical protein